MTSDLSSLALPDSPELPAEIERALKEVRACSQEGVETWNTAVEALRSAIARNFPTAEEAQTICDDWDNADWCVIQSFAKKAVFISAISKLRLLSGSSRGEE